MDEKRIESLVQVSKENPGVDLTPLLKENLQPPLPRRRVYFVSLLFPPFGLYYTVKYLLLDNDSNEKRRLGWIALVCTVLAIGAAIGSFALVAKLLVQTQPNLPENPTDLLREYQDIVR